jgi:hypothetical protein
MKNQYPPNSKLANFENHKEFVEKSNNCQTSFVGIQKSNSTTFVNRVWIETKYFLSFLNFSKSVSCA